jgi:NDP-sugar pyrophosphorylase family protein
MKTIWISGTIFNYEDLSELTNALQNAHCQLGNHAMLGDGVSLGDGVRIGYDVRIGDNVTLGDGVRIGNYVTLGNDITLGDGVRIGYDVRIGKSPLYITSDLPYLFNGYNDRIQIGCKDFTVAEWKESYEDIAERSGETNENVIQKYYKLICLYDEWRCK